LAAGAGAAAGGVAAAVAAFVDDALGCGMLRVGVTMGMLALLLRRTSLGAPVAGDRPINAVNRPHSCRQPRSRCVRAAGRRLGSEMRPVEALVAGLAAQTIA
jgi:hypothetical protein